MLPKKNRVDNKTVKRIFKASSPSQREGRSLHSPNLTFKFILTHSKATPKISFIAPKSVAKGAVDRNALRRLGYAAIKDHIHDFPLGIVGVFVFKKYQDDLTTLENEIKNLRNKIN